MVRYLLLGLACAVSGCVYQPAEMDSDGNTAARTPASPIRAYEKVGHPIRPAAGSVGQPSNLSTTIQRLQDAKRAYQAELNFEAAQRRHRQEACRKSEQGEEVPIEAGGLEAATYCQKVPSDEAGAKE